MVNCEFKALSESILQCICDLWHAADDRDKKEQLILGLDNLVRRFESQMQNEANALNEVDGALELSTEVGSTRFNQTMILRAREMLSVVQSSTGLLARHELQLTPERRAEEFQKISQSVQDFAVLLDEATA